MSSIHRDVRLCIPSGSDIKLGTSEIYNSSKEARPPISLGNKVKLKHFEISSVCKEVRPQIPSGSDFNLGHCKICRHPIKLERYRED